MAVDTNADCTPVINGSIRAARHAARPRAKRAATKVSRIMADAGAADVESCWALRGSHRYGIEAFTMRASKEL
jgi:hypothetical protein